jgi:glycosyltransferase involved in cell wall biosynthesis
MDYLVILPTLNEREGLAKTLDELFSVGVPPDKILVVDGGSTDGTCDVARERGVRCIMQEGRGKAAAVKTAFRHADADVLIVMDADFTYPAQHVRDLLAQDCDEVIGARREVEPGAQRLLYRFGNWVLTKWFNLIFGTDLTDVLSGMYAVRKAAAADMEFASRGFGIESEIAAHVASTGGTICEVPIRYRRRVGQKKLGLRHGLHIAWDMAALALRYNPAFFLSFAAALLALPGLGIAAWVAYKWIFLGVKHYVWGIIAFALVAGGVSAGAVAVLTLYLKRMEIRILRSLEATGGEGKDVMTQPSTTGGREETCEAARDKEATPRGYPKADRRLERRQSRRGRPAPDSGAEQGNVERFYVAPLRLTAEGCLWV